MSETFTYIHTDDEVPSAREQRRRVLISRYFGWDGDYDQGWDQNTNTPTRTGYFGQRNLGSPHDENHGENCARAMKIPAKDLPISKLRRILRGDEEWVWPDGLD